MGSIMQLGDNYASLSLEQAIALEVEQLSEIERGAMVEMSFAGWQFKLGPVTDLRQRWWSVYRDGKWVSGIGGLYLTDVITRAYAAHLKKERT